ncbi:MAG: hypothetical protein M5U12_15770 [Verrucomicrobia bacterium]|nr:hypothetical protein [Verrucomicrobiota bacterium]
MQAGLATHWSAEALGTRREPPATPGTLRRLLAGSSGPLLAHLELRFRLSREAGKTVLRGYVAQKTDQGPAPARPTRPARQGSRARLLQDLDQFVTAELRTRDPAAPGGGTRVATGKTILVTARQSATRRAGEALDREWAMAVLREAEVETRRFYERERRLDTWGVFRDGVLAPLRDGAPRPTDEELAQRHGFEGGLQAANALVTAKRRFGRTLRGVVARYVEDNGNLEAEVDAELRALMAVFP